MINNQLFFEMLNEVEYNIDNDNDNDNKKICYITNDALTDTHITLSCNHSFNYYPLYQEIVKQKCSIRNRLNHLALWMIECPYCRKPQNGILPYTKMPGVRRIKGVNSPKEWALITKNCKTCNEPCVHTYCSKHCEKINNKCVCLIKPKYKGLDIRQCHNKCIQIIQNGDEPIKLCGIHYNQYTKKGISALNLLKK